MFKPTPALSVTWLPTLDTAAWKRAALQPRNAHIHSFFPGQPSLPSAAAVQHLQTLPWVMLTTWPSECLFIHVLRASLHTASTGWRKVLLACQARTSTAVCCSSVYVNWTDESALAPCEAKRKPGRGAERPIFVQALLLSPGQTQVNKVNALLMSKARLLLISSALRGGEAILYTVKETSKERLQGMKAPAGDLVCLPSQRLPFSLLSSRHDKTQIHRSGVCNDRTAREQQRTSC